MSDLLLSCLIPTIPSRRETFLPRMLGQLEQQGFDRPVEVLALYDNKRQSVGHKCNLLLRMAQGKFITFFDDDDRIADDYVDLILDTIAKEPDADCIVYDQLCTTDRSHKQLCKYGIEHEYTSTNDRWTGKPAHTMVWRRELVESVEFEDASYGEDTNWVRHAWPKIRKQVRVDKILYYYDFNSRTTETRDAASHHRASTEQLTLPEAINHVPRSVVRRYVPVACSVVIATYNKAALLDKTLHSIFFQRPPFDYEVIVVDDGSNDGGQTETVCAKYQSYGNLMRYFRLESTDYCNPGLARNHGYRQARGAVIVAQSDDVVHVTDDTLARLATIEPGTFNIATVYNAASANGSPKDYYTGIENPRALFFLGSMRREHCYAIGGNCEDFTEPGYEDDWFGKCLIFGLGLRPAFRTDVVGWHQDHPRPNVSDHYARMKVVFDHKYRSASEGHAPWIGGPAWEYTEDPEELLSEEAFPSAPKKDLQDAQCAI